MFIFFISTYPALNLYSNFQDLENAPSCDAVIRERISKLPPEIADVSLLSQLKGYFYTQCFFKFEICNIVKYT